MIKITIDLNVIIDFLNKREFHREAAEILQLCYDNKIKGHICAHEITTLSYFLTKNSKDLSKIKSVISNFIKFYNIIEINSKILLKALDSEIKDFEDAVIEVSSIEKKVNYIVTRNISDFKKSRISTISPFEFLENYNRNKL